MLRSIAQGPAQISAVSTVTSSWLNDDPLAASQWISNLPGHSDARDAAVQQLINNQSRNDPDSAFIWAATIDNPTEPP